MIVDLAVAMPAINEGKVKAYGVTSAQRVKAMPDLPTIAEAGVPGYAATGWFSVVAPAGTPRPIIDRLNGVLMDFIKRPDTQDKMNALAITPLTSTPDELASLIPRQHAHGRGAGMRKESDIGNYRATPTAGGGLMG
jgi:tripartite-type tricarboxylate transporter receptor subunit TctC